MSMMEWAKREVEIASKRERGDKPEPYRRADVWHNLLDRYVKKTICNECFKKYDVGGKQ